MERMNFIDFFDEIETTEEYNGYFCSIVGAISIVVLGSLCCIGAIKTEFEKDGKKSEAVPYPN